MTIVLNFGLALIISAGVVLGSIPLVKSVALRCNCVDSPNQRKVHRQPMVRLGGVSIYLGTLLAFISLWVWGGFATVSTAAQAELLATMVGGTIFFLLGLWDDIKGLSALTRLWCQTAIATLMWCWGLQINGIMLPGLGMIDLLWLSLPVTLLWIVGIVNAVNWLDGLDGLASGVTGISALMVFVICLFTGQLAIALLALMLAGSLLGFLYYNFNPATIFMGDGGSYFIGFMVAAISLMGLVKSATATVILTPILILAVPLGDMATVILTRLWQGNSPFMADKSHLHHRLLQLGISHRWTVLFIYALSLWLGSLAFTTVRLSVGGIVFLAATVILGATSWQAWRLSRADQLSPGITRFWP
jgi:UDP-N-acetylmuramyl pentapeptide phosphotransferase/UDP-N-acetylglucosamine-1-phosphate transferase